MKPTKFTTPMVLGLILAVVASGCHKRPGDMTRIPGMKAPLTDMPSKEPIGPPAFSENDTNKLSGTPLPDFTKREGWPRNYDVFKSDIVHFDFDMLDGQSVRKAPRGCRRGLLEGQCAGRPRN